MKATKSLDIQGIDDEIHHGNHVSCRVTNTLINYLESLGYDPNSILEGLQYSMEYLCDPLNWVPYSVREVLQQRAADLVGDAKIMFNVGLMTPKLNSISGIEYMVKLLGNPKLAYQSVPKYSKLFDRMAEFETKIVDDCKAIVTMYSVPDYKFSKHHCYYAQGILAAIPTLWELPPAEVYERQCISETDAGLVTGVDSHDTAKCVYEVTWQPMSPLHSRLRDIFKRGNDTTSALKKLEANFHLLDEKNAELAQRNLQLSKVREIAIGIDRAGTIDEVLKLVVESAREIPGVRFLLVSKVDEERQIIRTPYYSKIYNENLYKALRAIGFDPDKQLGVNPTDSKLVFKVSQLKIAQDYIQNPRTIVRDRLSEVLAGVWPKVLCDSIQRILSVKRFVLVPIIVDGESWASMFFFLHGEVPIDVLEMIGVHCAIAVKNETITESLRLRNDELSLINTFISKTSKLLTLDDILGTATEELVKIFNAEASGIYTLNERGDSLEMRAQTGMPSEMANISKGIRSGSKIFKRLFAGNGVTVGNFAEYADEYPQHWSLAKKEDDIHFTSAVIYCRNQRYGLITVVRKGEATFNEHEKALLQSIAHQLSTSIENANLHRDVLDSENKLNLTLQSVSEGITVTDLEGKVKQVNDFVVKMHGYESADELIGRNAFQFIAPEDRDRAMKNMEKTLTTRSSGLIEYTFMKKDGSKFPAELSANLMNDVNGNPVGFVASTRNISERKQAELQLRESERKYRLITDSTTDFIAVLTFKGIYVYVSPSHRRLGYETEELVGKSGFDYIHPDDRKRLLPLLGKYAAMKLRDLLGLKKESFSEEISFRFRDKSGEWHFIEATANLVDAPDGGLNILLTCRDMSERKKADDLLRESEEKYRTIFESVNDILILLDKKGKIVDVNEKVREIGGYSRKDLVGKNFRSLIKVMPKRSIAIIAKNFIRTMLGFAFPTHEVDMYRSNGEIANIEINAVAVEKNGEIVGSLASLRDITDRRKAETALRRQKELIDRILESTPNAVIVVEKGGRIVLANRTFCEGFVSRAKQVEGKLLSEVVPVSMIADEVSSVLAQKQTQSQVEFRHKINKHEKICIANIIAMDDKQVLLIMQDVTEERERQERLYLTDRLASVGEMASGIAHELNNPLTGVIGLSQLLVNDESLPTDLKEDAEAIHSEAQRAAAVVRNLLTFARKHASVREPTQINKVVEDVLRLRAYEHKVNNIQVNTLLDPALPEIEADYFQLQQVFLNIILNAESVMIEAHKGGTLTTTTKMADGHIVISFADDGPGIPKENLDRLFDPFFTTKEIGKGTGLGLSICYGIVTSHGGRIYPQSEKGKGATFIIKLPVNVR